MPQLKKKNGSALVAIVSLPMVIGIGIAAYFAVASESDRIKRGLSIAGVLIILLSLPHFIHSFAEWRARLISDCRSISLINVQAGKWIRQNTPENSVIGVNDAGATRYFSERRTIDLMGLNCADIAFNKIKPESAGIIDYLVINPSWFHGKGLYDGLPVCTNFTIPPEEYTITINKGQAEIVIFRCR